MSKKESPGLMTIYILEECEDYESPIFLGAYTDKKVAEKIQKELNTKYRCKKAKYQITPRELDKNERVLDMLLGER